MTDEKEGIWNGGNTYTKRELEILRKQEDQYDQCVVNENKRRVSQERKNDERRIKL